MYIGKRLHLKETRGHEFDACERKASIAKNKLPEARSDFAEDCIEASVRHIYAIIQV